MPIILHCYYVSGVVMCFHFLNLIMIICFQIYAVSSWMDLMWKDESFYFTLVRDWCVLLNINTSWILFSGELKYIFSHSFISYEAYVLYMFFRLLIELSDGEESLIQKLEAVPQMK